MHLYIQKHIIILLLAIFTDINHQKMIVKRLYIFTVNTVALEEILKLNLRTFARTKFLQSLSLLLAARQNVR